MTSAIIGAIVAFIVIAVSIYVWRRGKAPPTPVDGPAADSAATPIAPPPALVSARSAVATAYEAAVKLEKVTAPAAISSNKLASTYAAAAKRLETAADVARGAVAEAAPRANAVGVAQLGLTTAADSLVAAYGAYKKGGHGQPDVSKAVNGPGHRTAYGAAMAAVKALAALA